MNWNTNVFYWYLHKLCWQKKYLAWISSSLLMSIRSIFNEVSDDVYYGLYKSQAHYW